MKRFIRYLYEYEQGERMRNVGFVKVEKDDEQCMVHIHGKGFHMGSKGSLAIYLIFEEDGECVGVWQGEEDNIDPAINRSFVYTKENVGMPENFEKINGVVLESQNGQRYGAIWDDRAMNISRMRIWMPGEQEEDADDREEEEIRDRDNREEVRDRDDREIGEIRDRDDREIGEIRDRDDREIGEERDRDDREIGEIRDRDNREIGEERDRDDREIRELQGEDDGDEELSHELPEMSEEFLENRDERELREAPEEPDADNGERRSREIPVANSIGGIEVMPFLQSESVSFSRNRQREIHKPKVPWKVRKIQRTELSKLARCEWHLANNNFLLHGYYNYHHLVLLESSEQTMLGVPGIYHEKEGRAAAAFGFAKFIAKDEAGVSLRPEECNEDYPFGYWCRPVKTMSRWQ